MNQFWKAAKYWLSPIGLIVVAYAIFYGLVMVLHTATKPFLARLGKEMSWEVCAAISAVVALLAIALVFEHKKIRHIGLCRKQFLVPFAQGWLVGTAQFTLTMGALMAIGSLRIIGYGGTVNWGREFALNTSIGINEECMDRGVLFRILEERFGSLIALVSSSLFFGLSHIGNGAGVVGPIMLATDFTEAAIYMATRSLWAAIAIHAAWDFCEGPICDMIDSGFKPGQHFFTAVMHGPDILTGGQFGPEASIVTTLIQLVFDALLLWWAVRKGQWKAVPWRKRAAVASQLPS